VDQHFIFANIGCGIPLPTYGIRRGPSLYMVPGDERALQPFAELSWGSQRTPYPGHYSFEAKATDTLGQTASQTWSGTFSPPSLTITTSSLPNGATVSPGSSFAPSIMLPSGAADDYTVTITATDTAGLSETLMLDARAAAQPGMYCQSPTGYGIFGVGLTVTTNPQTTGQLAGNLMAHVYNSSNTGWVSTISNASIVFWGPGPLWGQQLGSNPATVTSQPDQPVTLPVPVTPIQYPGYGFYYFLARGVVSKNLRPLP
jgi:hypothetical protein